MVGDVGAGRLHARIPALYEAAPSFDKGNDRTIVPHGNSPDTGGDSAGPRDAAGLDHEGDALEKTFTFGSFREAFSFMTRVALEAETMDHHPDWTNVYNRVTVRLNTHAAGSKITAKDVELARRIQKISWVG